eukprot:snap_masked-scaffold_9-processed-gene-6.13-mRNA-1 protein AED:1.00 eAED:1.00 QI:0/0/0/0/1/1/2/0/141
MEKVMKMVEVEDMKPTGVSLAKKEQNTIVEKLLSDKKMYKPDLAFTSHLLLNYQIIPTETLPKKVKKAVSYQYQSNEECLKIGGMRELNRLTTFIDTSFATRERSISASGECIFINQGLISYETRRETIGTEYEIEAKYVG